MNLLIWLINQGHITYKEAIWILIVVGFVLGIIFTAIHYFT